MATFSSSLCRGESSSGIVTPTLIIVMGTSGSGKSTLGASLASALQIPFIDGDDLHPQANVDKMAAGQPLDDGDREPWLERIRSTALQTLVGEDPAEGSRDESSGAADPPRSARGETKRLAEVYETSAHHPRPEHEDEQAAQSIKEAGDSRDSAQGRQSQTGIVSSSYESSGAPQPRPPAMVVACSALKKSYRALLRGEQTSLSSSDSPPAAPSPLQVLHLYVDVSPEELLRRMRERKGHFMKDDMLQSQLATLEKPQEGSGEAGIIVVEDGRKDDVESRAEQRVREALGLQK
ncbi:unnamed protein product [Parajaminaea phylloscopi]